MTKNYSLYLASQSPRRRELLEQIGVGYKTVNIDVNESHIAAEPAEIYVQRIAFEKAKQGLAVLQKKNYKADKKSLRHWQSTKKHATIEIVVAADTAVVIGKEILGKPNSSEQALSMLLQLAGRRHEVMTGVTVSSRTKTVYALSRTTVTFSDICESDARRYIATNEGIDKAGSYAVQGLAAIFIEKIEGSYSGVMGLPLFETAKLLEQMGLNVLPSAKL